MPEPEASDDAEELGISVALLRLLFSSAYAEDSRPSSITGQRIGGRARSASGGVSAVVYPGLFDAVTDVRLSALTTGVKEDVIVRQYTGNHVYAYRLSTQGLTARQSGQEILLYNEDGQALAKLEAPHMTDAAGNYSTDISVSLEGGGGSYTVTYAPNDAWMQTASYPVTIDPTGSYFNDLATGIGDVYVSSANPGKHYDHTVDRGSPQRNHNLEGTNLYAGNNGSDNIALIIPSLTGFAGSDGNVSEFPTGTDLLIESAMWNVYVHEVGGNGQFKISLVTGSWNTSTVTYNSRPSLSSEISIDVSLHTGWNSVDVTRLFSAWFNAADQKQNYGIAVTSGSAWARICSSDVLPRNERMNFSATYVTGIGTPTLTATPHGYGTNSESGWVDLSWNKVSGASGYTIGIYNGQKYEYQFVGNTTSFTTKGKNLWPTDEEIAAGKYALHWDGAGQELPNIPRLGQSDLNYYFRVMPTNAYGQTAGSATAATVSALLPDTTPPSQPATVSVSPADWSSTGTHTITWAGITDQPGNASTLGTGHVQYVVNPAGTDAAAWAWQNTAYNTANGSFTLDTSAFADGSHAVYVRGTDSAGNYGAPKGVQLYVDKTPPTAPDVSILPDEWTKDDSASLTWTGISDINDLLRVEYAIDGGAYLTTNLADKTCAGFPLDISALTDGEHTYAVRGVDVAGNEGAAGTATVRIDRGAPTLLASSIDPVGWVDTESVTLSWEGAADAYSGLAQMDYAIDGGEFVPLEVAETGSKEIDITALADGEHTITLHLTDALGNSASWEHKFYVDVTPPQVELLTPPDGTVVTGVLDTGEFADGETIEIALVAHDQAGHESTARGVFIKADHSAQPVVADVTVTAPAQGEIITTAHTQAAYTREYAGSESDSRVIFDGQSAGSASSQKFDLYPILYPEGSTHSLSVISRDGGDVLHYARGMASLLILSDIWKDESKVASHSGVELTPMGAVCAGDSGQLTSVAFSAAQSVQAIRLHTLAQGSVTYEYSIDGGASWHAIRDGRDAWFDVPQRSVQIRANLSGAGTILQGLDVTGVYEMNPVRFKVQLLRPVTSFHLTGGSEFTEAMPAIETDCPAELTTRRLYMDGAWNSNTFTANLLPCEDGSVHTVTALGLDASGRLYGSGAKTSLLLRTAPGAKGVYESGRLTLNGDAYAIRLETLCQDDSGKVVTSGLYAYSYDGKTWTDFELNDYAFLPQAARTLYVRAMLPEGVTLRALHLEGVTAAGKAISTSLIKAPANVQAADYGDYYENEKLRRYVITWSDANRDDPSLANEIYFDIYRDGKRIATTRSTRYEDYDYVSGAVYHVAARRVYDDPQDGLASELTRTSARVKAKSVYIPREERVEGVAHNVEDFTQSEYLNDLYGGNYTFSAEPNPPSHEFALDQSLLGPHRFCSLGFEPLNFNTGNFFLQTQDLRLADLGGSALEIIRTYNSQSAETDGPFGAKWATEYGQHLRLFNDGSVGYRRADGSEIIFYIQPDGTFTSNSTEYESLAYDDARTEYRIALTDGTVYAFASGGLLSRIEEDGGQHVTQIVRDEDGLITKIIAPSQEELLVEMDENGHIVKLTTPSGAELTYGYKGRNLVSFTDANGETTKYQYDSQGRMTAWYDASGKRQVQNQYDKQSRVTAQTNANGGQYKIQYEDGYTVATDAEGNVVTYSYDERKRTTKIVDALGGETLYTYGQQGEIVSMTDPLGNVTTYAYNENGDKIAEVDPRGAAVVMEWDDNHHLLSMTDQNGHITAYTYDTNGNLLTETAPDGGVTVYTYDSKGRMVEKTDALGGVTAYEYVNGLLAKVTDPEGNETAYTYDANGNLASMTDALGNVTRYEYDGSGNLLSLTFADGTQVTYTYDALGRQTSMTDPRGNVTKYAYDGLGNLTKTTLPDGTTQTAAYTRNGQRKSVTDALENKTAYTYDGNGNQLTVTDPMGNKTVSEYDAAGRLLRETNALGGVTEYTYDQVGLPLTVTDATGATQVMTYDLAGNLLTRTLPSGASISVAYDSMNRPVRQVNALGGVTEIEYDLLGRITRVTDPLGAETTYAYDKNGNLLTVTDALGGVISYAYDALSRVISETAPDGGVTRYAYDSVGNLVSVTDALGSVTRYQYDENGNLAAMTDALGQTVSLEYNKNGSATTAIQKNGGVLATGYDKAGRVVFETDANGHATKYGYNRNGLITKVTDALGQQATFAYDALGNIVKITALGNSITMYEYDSAGRALTMTDPEGCVTEYGYNENSQIASLTVNGNATLYEYDAAGNIAAVTDAEGRRVTFAYDLNGNLTEVVYPDGTKDTTEYDALGRVLKNTPRTGLATAYEYDEVGNIVSVTQGEQVTRYAYDILGRMVAVTAPDGTETAYTYDALGNLTSETDPLGNTTAFAYTAESLLEKVTYANGSTQSLTYDLAGNVTAETDAEGNTKQYQYDKVNRLIAVIDELGGKTSYKYDALDNIAQVTDALQHVARYTYDKNGNLLTETDALGNKVQYAYTPEGWLESITRADGTVLTFTYDKTGSLLAQNVGDGQTIQSSYNEIGMVTEVSSAEGTIVYQYDEQGYLVSVTNVNGDVVSYTYDAYGNKTSMTYPDGRTVSYTYDRMNRMTSVTGLDGDVTRYAYDAAGRRVETASSTLTTAYSYDSVGNLLTQATSGASEIAFSYSYNKNGYITGEVRKENGTTTTTSTYAYDALGQLTSFLQSTGYGEQYAYDKAGNMTEKVLTGTDGIETALKMSYNKANQLTGMANGKDKITYKYDKNGSMVEKALSSKTYGKLTDSYAYNALDQLTEYVGYDGYQQAFVYDANGMRLSKSEAGNGNRSTLEELLRGNIAGLPEIVEPAQGQTNADEADMPTELEWATTEYLYDLTQEYYQVISETSTSKNGSTTTAYAYGLERIAAYTASSKTSYVYDGRGAVAQAVTAPIAGEAVSSALPDIGVQVQSFSYTAFGEQMGTRKVSGYAYNAEAYDAATGMLNLRARLYEPAMNRFSQKDIIRGQATSPLSLNRYAYCVNNPVMHTDPSGESVLDSIGTWWNKAKQTALGQFVDTFVVQPIVKMAQKIANVVATVAKTAIKSAAEKAAKEYNTEAFQLFSSILQKIDGDGVYYSEKFKAVVDNMQSELRSLDPSDVNYKKKAQEIVAKYCDYFNNYEAQKNNALDAYDSLTAWMKDTQKNKATWLGNGRDLLKEMSAAKEEYPPQIRALIEQYSSEVIIGKETTLTNVKLSNKRENELAIVEAKLKEFYGNPAQRKNNQKDEKGV